MIIFTLIEDFVCIYNHFKCKGMQNDVLLKPEFPYFGCRTDLATLSGQESKDHPILMRIPARPKCGEKRLEHRRPTFFFASESQSAPKSALKFWYFES